jgi:hypothetical protein
VSVAALDDHHPTSLDVERMEQVELGQGWYRLTSTPFSSFLGGGSTSVS